MRDGTEHDNWFAVEVSALRRGRRQPGAPSSVRSPFERRLPPLAHAARLGLVLLAATLVCAAALPSVRALVAMRLPFATPGVGQSPGALSGLPARDTGVWAALSSRPLHLAALASGSSCPVTAPASFTTGVAPGQGAGPVYVVAPGSASGALRYPPDNPPPNAYGVRDTQSGGVPVAWYIRPDYQGPVLIRGRQLDGRNALGFSGGLDQPQQTTSLPGAPSLYALRLLGDSQYGAPWPAWPAYIRLAAPGCYAYQVDGLSFSETIVFRAALMPTTPD